MAGTGADTAATVVLRLPASAAHVRTARLVAAAMARRSGVDEALLDEVRLAVGEACARAVRLHERYGVDKPVTVEFGDVERFSVSVIDCAPVDSAVAAGGTSGFNHGAAPVPVVAGSSAAPGMVTASTASASTASASDGGPRSPEAAVDPDNLVPIRPIDGAAELTAGLGSGTSDTDPPAGTSSPFPSDAGWLDATADALGLALLDAMVQDLEVTEAGPGAGTRVAMSWPLER